MNANYEIRTLDFNELKSVTLPKFQRSVVWADEKKRDFITTLLSGSPFGSILLYKESLDKYLLVDGLQRISTLKEFESNPLKFVEIEEMISSDIEKLVSNIFETNGMGGSTRGSVSAIYSSFKTNFSTSCDVAGTFEKIVSDVGLLKYTNDTYFQSFAILSKLILKLQNNFSLTNLKIPAIVFTGDFDSLPEIFEKMNSTGTALSRYDIFAAKWCNINFKIEDYEILQIVDKRYQETVEESKLTISDYVIGSIIESKEINLYEYCYAFGKLIKSHCPLLFGFKNSNSKVDSIGFSLLSSILLKSSKKMGSMSFLFQKDLSYLNDFQNKVLETVKLVEKILKSYIETIDGQNLSKCSETQIICIVSTLFGIKFISTGMDNFAFSARENSSSVFKEFVKNMPKNYLYDIISGYWAGSGDSKLANELQKDIEENRFVKTIDPFRWNALLDDWTSSLTQKAMKQRSFEERLFMNYIMSSRIPKTKYHNKPFELECIIPEKRFNTTFKNKNGLCALGNLCFIPQFENRSKQDKTIYEQIDNKSIVYDVHEEILEEFIYPERNEIAFVTSSDTFTYERFLSFVKERQKHLVALFISSIK